MPFWLECYRCHNPPGYWVVRISVRLAILQLEPVEGILRRYFIEVRVVFLGQIVQRRRHVAAFCTTGEWSQTS